MSDLEAVLLRIERLERANRRWRLWGALTSVACCATLLLASAQRADDTLTAQRFVLRGPGGEEHAELGLDEQGHAQLRLTEGKATALLSTYGPGLLLRAQDGRRGAFLGIDPSNAAKLELTSDKILDGVRLAVQESGQAGVYVLNAQGFEVAAMEALPSGAAHFTARDGARRVRALFGLDDQEIPNLMLMDALGRRRVGMLINPGEEGLPLFALEDAHGRSRAELTQHFDGSPFFQLLREDGEPSFRAP